jgi:hypothetical protein
MRTSLHTAAAFAAVVLLVAGCKGSGKGGSKSSSTAGIGLPSEISALPATGAAAGLRALSARLASTGGDYAAAQAVKFVDERSLSQFDILNTIFGAVAQTHYADPANVGAGPYGTIVSWMENNGDKEQKSLVRWVVDSSMIQKGGQAVNRVKVWFFEPKDGVMRTIRIVLDISQAPTQAADGTYTDYGVWTLTAKLSGDGSPLLYFTAAADHAASGLSEVKVHDATNGAGEEMAGILIRSEAQGQGLVRYPDWNSCSSNDCTPDLVTVAYVYDADAVALSKDGGAAVYKSRTDTVDVVNRYGLYDAKTGEDVNSSHAFGFPVRFTVNGVEQYGCYGAWQGRHQVWGNGSTVTPGTTVVRSDLASGQAAKSYVTSPVFTGVLVRRSYAPTTLEELTGVVLDTWVNDSANLAFNGTSWTVSSGSSALSNLNLLVADAQDTQRSVSINRWDSNTNTSMSLVYADGKFWVATGQPAVRTTTEWVPTSGAQLWVNVSGSVYVYFDGSGWKQKTVASFDATTFTPTFGLADTSFTFTPGRDYFLSASGVNYRLSIAAGGTVTAAIEQQTVPNPTTASTVVPDGVLFKRLWGGDTTTTFRYGTDPSRADFLQLVYAQPGIQDVAAGKVAGDPVEEGISNLWSSASSDQYSWEYPSSSSGGYGTQQYLLSGDGTYLVLDNPITLAPVSLASFDLQTRSYALQFDGSWVGGLPNLYDQLRSTGFDMSPGIAAQVVNVGDGTLVTDALDPSKQYRFKQLQISQYLLTVADPGNLDLAPAQALDLTDVPAYVDQGMGAAPSVALKYSEGVAVQ